MAFKIGNNTISKVIVSSTAQQMSIPMRIVNVNNNGTITEIFRESYTLSIIQGIGVRSVVVRRTSPKKGTIGYANNMSVYNGDDIYYEDKLTILASAAPGYIMSSCTSNIASVQGDVTVKALANFTSWPAKPPAHSSYTDSGSSVTFKIYNPNSYGVYFTGTFSINDIVGPHEQNFEDEYIEGYGYFTTTIYSLGTTTDDSTSCPTWSGTFYDADGYQISNTSEW